MKVGYHRISGVKVALKNMSKHLYKVNSKLNKLSEDAAIELFHKNPNVVNLVERFYFDKQAFIVTKYAGVGDLY